ncbi:hypothetical protein JCM11641_001867 [Rhodosporidiobolus odoratus]
MPDTLTHIDGNCTNLVLLSVAGPHRGREEADVSPFNRTSGLNETAIAEHFAGRFNGTLAHGWNASELLASFSVSTLNASAHHGHGPSHQAHSGEDEDKNPADIILPARLEKRSASVQAVRALRAQIDSSELTKRAPQNNRNGPGNRGNNGPGRSPNNGGANNGGPSGRGVPGRGPGGPPGGRPGNGNGSNPGPENGPDTDNDPQNYGRFVVCSQSYNGVGEPLCDYGSCRLRCPPGLREFFAHNPELPSFCAE